MRPETSSAHELAVGQENCSVFQERLEVSRALHPHVVLVEAAEDVSGIPIITDWVVVDVEGYFDVLVVGGVVRLAVVVG